MKRMVGTTSIGIRAPIICQGDDIANIAVECVMRAVNNGELRIKDGDILAMTEAIVARAQGYFDNYATE